jgi:uncharacterized protein (DUF697 family)/predicted GTPase
MRGHGDDGSRRRLEATAPRRGHVMKDKSLTGWWQRLRLWRPISEAQYRAERAAILRDAPVPVFWLFGKTGSGKTSIVRFLTGAERAEIGTGFQPQTTQSEQYDFPCPETPLLRFLDTRGLGESYYDPTEDIRRFADSADMMIVTAKVMDHALEAVIEPLRQIRRASPRRPVLLALTCLHEAYPGQPHPDPDPFREELLPDTLPADLRRSLERHQQQFDGLVDAVVPIDLTPAHEGYVPSEFGGERLKEAIIERLPAAYRQTLLSLDAAMSSLKDLYERRAMPYVLSYSTLAATAGAVPIPWIDVPLVIALQGHLVAKLAALYGQPVGAKVLAGLPGPMGTRLATRLLLKSTWKFVPYVGIAANAAMSYASTYGLGKACCWYFSQVQRGHAPSETELRQVWSEQMAQAAKLWRTPAEPSAS